MSVNAPPKHRKLWTEAEDNILRKEAANQAKSGKVKDWRAIAKKLPERTNRDCRKRWIKLDGPINMGKWSEEEDQRLRHAVQLHSTVWTEVSRFVGTRHADQCAKRWLHFVNPDLDHSEWTDEDDRKLLAEVEKHGRNWRKIVDEELLGRSATDAKNRYSFLQRSRRKYERMQNVSDDRLAAERSVGPPVEVEENVLQLEKRHDNDRMSDNSSTTVPDILLDSFPVDILEDHAERLSEEINEFLSQHQQLEYQDIITQSGDSERISLETSYLMELDSGTTDEPCGGLSSPFVHHYAGLSFDEGASGVIPTQMTRYTNASLRRHLRPYGSLPTPGTLDTDDEYESKRCGEDTISEAINQELNETQEQKQKNVTMVLDGVQPDQVKAVLAVIFSSNSTVDVRISNRKDT